MQTRHAPPIEFEKLLPLLEHEPQVLAEIHALLEQKRNAPELGLAPAVPILNAFIEAELDRAPADVPKKPRSPHVVALLNQLFHGALREHEALRA